MVPCNNCEQQYVRQTSKKIRTRLTEHKNTINRHDLRSLPATHIYNNGHTFNWSQTKLLDQATTKHAREFKEAWYSINENTINGHIEVPTVFLQLRHFHNTIKHIRRPPAVSNLIPAIQDDPTMTTRPATTNQTPQSTKAPIRRSRRIHQRREQRDNSNSL